MRHVSRCSCGGSPRIDRYKHVCGGEDVMRFRIYCSRCEKRTVAIDVPYEEGCNSGAGHVTAEYTYSDDALDRIAHLVTLWNEISRLP